MNTKSFKSGMKIIRLQKGFKDKDEIENEKLLLLD